MCACLHFLLESLSQDDSVFETAGSNSTPIFFSSYVWCSDKFLSRKRQRKRVTKVAKLLSCRCFSIEKRQDDEIPLYFVDNCIEDNWCIWPGTLFIATLCITNKKKSGKSWILLI